MPNLLAILPKPKWKHPNPHLQLAWDSTKIGLAIFPLLSYLGAVFIAVGLVQTWRNSSREICRQLANWGFLALSLWLIFVSLFGIDPGNALLGLANFLPFFAFFAAYSILIRSPDQLRQLAWIFTLSAVPLMLLGGIQLWGWGGIIALPGNVLLELIPGGNPPGRMSAIFMHANTLAAYLQMVLAFSIGLLLDRLDRDIAERTVDGKQPVTWKSPVVWGLTGIIALCGLSLVLTSSRGAWGGAIFICLTFALYRGWYWLVGIFAALSVAILSAAYAPSPLKEPLRSIVPRYFWARINDEMYPDRPDALTRTAQYHFATKLIGDRPLTGWGLQSFEPLYREATGIVLGYPHSFPLMLASNLGIPATLALCGLVGWILNRATLLFLNFPLAWRSERTLYFSYLVAFAGFISFNLTDVTLIDLRLNTYAWLVLACLCGVFYQSQNSGDRR